MLGSTLSKLVNFYTVRDSDEFHLSLDIPNKIIVHKHCNLLARGTDLINSIKCIGEGFKILTVY